MKEMKFLSCFILCLMSIFIILGYVIEPLLGIHSLIGAIASVLTGIITGILFANLYLKL